MQTLNKTIHVTAHRGSSKSAPENTLSSIDLAIREQADYAEVDVQQTKDGSLVLLHDSNLRRVAGLDQNIWELSDQEVRKLDVGRWFSPTFAGEKMPFLEEVIEAVKGKIKLNIELKYYGGGQNLAERLVELIREQNFAHQCVITSFNYGIISQVKSLDRGLKTGLITAKKVTNVSELDVDFYSVHKLIATNKFIRNAHAHGKDVHVWTVNRRLNMEILLARGVDNIITDTPKKLRALLLN